LAESVGIGKGDDEANLVKIMMFVVQHWHMTLLFASN
jgi:hypothetical protein